MHPLVYCLLLVPAASQAPAVPQAPPAREDPEPAPAARSCLCSERCVCGCNETGRCDCAVSVGTSAARPVLQFSPQPAWRTPAPLRSPAPASRQTFPQPPPRFVPTPAGRFLPTPRPAAQPFWRAAPACPT